MARIILETRLKAPVDRVWDALQHPETFAKISAPLVRIKPEGAAAVPTDWASGPFAVRLLAFGILPVGWQIIDLTVTPAAEGGEGGGQMHDHGHGSLARGWHHVITVAPDGSGTRYRDCLDVDAGWRTAFLVPMLRAFYRYRQRRLARLLDTRPRA